MSNPKDYICPKCGNMTLDRGRGFKFQCLRTDCYWQGDDAKYLVASEESCYQQLMEKDKKCEYCVEIGTKYQCNVDIVHSLKLGFVSYIPCSYEEQGKCSLANKDFGVMLDF
jgi:hypothetical protein